MKKIGKYLLISFGVFIVLAILIVVINPAGNKDKGTQQETQKPSPATTTASNNAAQKAQAQKELDDIIALGKKAGLVVSYEFSDRASVVFIGATWYTQTVAFKKDFMAKVATLKKVITGYQHFEVRDAYSNEKVGEVTALTGSLEVYK